MYVTFLSDLDSNKKSSRNKVRFQTLHNTYNFYLWPVRFAKRSMQHAFKKYPQMQLDIQLFWPRR